MSAGVTADVTVAVVEVAVALPAVLAAEHGVPGRYGGVRVALPDSDGSHRLLAIPVARQSGISLGERRHRYRR